MTGQIDDGTNDDGTNDDGTNDDGTNVDGTNDDGTNDDGTIWNPQRNMMVKARIRLSLARLMALNAEQTGRLVSDKHSCCGLPLRNAKRIRRNEVQNVSSLSIALNM